jgi:hypothetical protein
MFAIDSVSIDSVSIDSVCVLANASQLYVVVRSETHCTELLCEICWLIEL